jgi:hypothetical protein
MQHNSSISNFKRSCYRLLLPSLAAIVLLCYVLNYVFERVIIGGSEMSGAYKVNRIINKTDPREIPIFGSSRAEGSYIPDSIGSNVFDYGISGTQDDIWLFFLQKELKKQKTTPIIINLDLEGLNAEKGDAGYWLYNADNPDVRRIIGNDWKPYYSFPLVKYFGKIEYYVADYLNTKKQVTKVVTKGASLERNEISDAAFKELVDARLKAGETFRNDTGIFRHMLQVLQTVKNRNIYFVIAPYHPSYQRSHVNTKQANEFIAYLRTIPNVKVLYYATMPLPDNCFMNTTHVNYKGAQVFSSQLKKDLKLQ